MLRLEVAVMLSKALIAPPALDSNFVNIRQGPMAIYIPPLLCFAAGIYASSPSQANAQAVSDR